MNIEELKQQFHNEGFPHVFEWTDEPNAIYGPHTHQGKVSVYVVRGEVVFSDGIERTVKTGERFDIPPGVRHTAVIGSEGCDWIVGEEVEGDA